MYAFLLLSCFIFAASEFFFCGSTHMIVDDRLSNQNAIASYSKNLEMSSPPVAIVELPKASVKKKKTKKHKKNKYGGNKRPFRPANCVSLWGSCKAPGKTCCDPCAFCKCRLFKTVCFCRLGNPQC
ncbi:agouti-signaling protein [Gouania willdenowi]|uniref:Agouti-signaling protein n=1 Tax=Gouania willdenowi TaxID=441366 RepID=A0A8C5D4M9_GOUWI|nr:agouti-signaling protein [Gouania willdenowi]